MNTHTSPGMGVIPLTIISDIHDGLSLTFPLLLFSSRLYCFWLMDSGRGTFVEEGEGEMIDDGKWKE